MINPAFLLELKPSSSIPFKVSVNESQNCGALKPEVLRKAQGISSKQIFCLVECSIEPVVQYFGFFLETRNQLTTKTV